jgi:hypothetical protein
MLEVSITWGWIWWGEKKGNVPPVLIELSSGKKLWAIKASNGVFGNMVESEFFSILLYFFQKQIIFFSNLIFLNFISQSQTSKFAQWIRIKFEFQKIQFPNIP